MSRPLFTLAFAFALLALAASPAAAKFPARGDIVCGRADAPRGMVVLIHGGGFLAGAAGDYRLDCQSFAALGFRAVSGARPLKGGLLSNLRSRHNA